MPSRGQRRSRTRPTLYQLCRAGERFEVGDGPRDLSALEELILGRGDPSRNRSTRYYVDDPWMSSKHARIARRESTTDQFFIEDDGSTNGVVVNGAPITRVPLAHGDLIETGRTFWLYQEEPSDLELPTDPVEFGTWATWSPALAEQLKMLMAKVETGDHLLIDGPNGTGKGYLARTVHLMSARTGRFVHLDCRERRPKRLEVDLFGGEGQKARLREADLGTLFLENIEVLPLSLQERLCDALDQRTVTSSRGRQVRIDVRVIASTNDEPDTLVKKRQISARFRDTLGAIRFALPGLSERRADLGLLLDDFLARARGAPALSRDACRAVLTHEWRLQVKALARVIEAAAVLAANFDDAGNRIGKIETTHLPVEVLGEEGVRALLPQAEPLGRPPSSLHAPPPDAAHQVGPSVSPPASPPVVPAPRQPGRVPAPIAIADPERTNDVPENAPVDDRVRSDAASGFLEEVRQVEDFVDQFDALDATDPALSEMAANIRPGTRPPTVGRSTAVRPIAPSSEPSTPGERPPSAQYDIQSIERSYANAVDPDLIVESLRRSRGNVSAAARYLGKPRALVLKWMREFQIDPYDYRDG